ncbi:MFS transporter [Microbispora sp. NPDC088329]|uniref:MFS transporter n=1 Tax=Microbispora sp. NPDC088329 TaxID=3154869 RepID=UPI00343070B2
MLIQRGARAPMLPARVLADRGRSGAILVMLLMGAGQLATFYFLTLYMQAIEHYSPMITGLAYLPFAIGIGLGSGAIGPTLQARTSTRNVLTIGMVVAAAAMGWFSLLVPDQNAFLVLLPAQLVGGVGLGIGFVAATIGGVRGIAPQDSGIASGLVNTSQQIGGALGLAVLAGVAVTATADAPRGMAVREALTSGYTTGMLGAGVFYLAAVVAAALLLRDSPRRRRRAL